MAKRHGSGRNACDFRWQFRSSGVGTLTATQRGMTTAMTATALDRYRASLKRVDILDAETERELAQSWTEGNEA
ncbi:MAG: hypothetical protein WBN10_07990, partial [Polyangiales bacterium]